MTKPNGNQFADLVFKSLREKRANVNQLAERLHCDKHRADSIIANAYRIVARDAIDRLVKEKRAYIDLAGCFRATKQASQAVKPAGMEKTKRHVLEWIKAKEAESDDPVRTSDFNQLRPNKDREETINAAICELIVEGKLSVSADATLTISKPASSENSAEKIPSASDCE